MSHGKGMQIRAGNRGGRDQFDWEDVKVDKYRENYLGKQLLLSVFAYSSYSVTVKKICLKIYLFTLFIPVSFQATH